MQQHDLGGRAVTPNTPWLVDNIYQGFSTESISETLNLVQYEKDLAGSTVIKQLTSRRIFDRMGGKLGSYWGNEENLQYSTPELQPNGKSESVISGVVLTDTAAAVAVYDATYDLEKLFESATKGRYVLKLTSMAGLAYYGWIGGVSVSSNVYTFSIYSEVGLSTQTWVKTWGTGIAGPYRSVEIFDYSTSVEFASADTFNVELPYSENATDYNQLKSLANGEYRIDYRRGRLLGRKLNADDTEGITYLGLKSGPAAITGFATSALQGGGLPAALGAGGGLKIDGSGTALPVSLASVPSHAVTNAGTFAVQNGASTTGGATMWKSLDVDETEDEVKSSAGQIFMIHAMNMKASVLYLKVYNNTAAGVTVGTTVPDWTFPVPTLATTNGAGFVVAFPTGVACGTGITIACTTGFADNDSGAPGANEMIVNIAYK